MRKLLGLLGALLAVHIALLFVRPSEAEIPVPGDGVEIGIVFDVGGLGDKSFNDGAYLGAERAAKELGANVRFIEPGEGAATAEGKRAVEQLFARA